MSLFKAVTTLISTPIKCVGELGKDLSSLTDDKKDGLDGILSLGTFGASSIVKGVVKSLEKVGEELEK